MSDTHPEPNPHDEDEHRPEDAPTVQSDEERHEEALEESFPASDPPSAKHIT